jgi:methionine synthase II (cobalamin-independent)
MSIERTVIGSFPRWADSLEKAIEEVVNMQLHYGIDMITDGEQRGGMIEYFEQIPGLERIDGKLKIIGKIEPMDDIDGFYKIKDYKKVKAILESQERKDVKVKVTFTGPITLGISCISTDMKSAMKYYNVKDREALYSDCSYALLPLAKRALDIGAYVQFDEPGFGFTSPEPAKKVLNDLISHLPSSTIEEGKISTHVCGSIGGIAKLYDELLDLDFPILSLAFSGKEERNNIDVITRKSLEEHKKRLGVGFISNIDIEDDKIALERLTTIAQKIGVENIAYIHPDCGFGSTSPEKVRPILDNMKKASDVFTSEFGGPKIYDRF